MCSCACRIHIWSYIIHILSYIIINHVIIIYHSSLISIYIYICLYVHHRISLYQHISLSSWTLAPRFVVVAWAVDTATIRNVQKVFLWNDGCIQWMLSIFCSYVIAIWIFGFVYIYIRCFKAIVAEVLPFPLCRWGIFRGLDWFMIPRFRSDCRWNIRFLEVWEQHPFQSLRVCLSKRFDRLMEYRYIYTVYIDECV